MSVLYLLSWIGILVQMMFMLVAIASGLYYLAEIIEENTEVARKVIRYITIFALATYGAIFLFDELPFPMIFCGVLSHGVHLLILVEFPFISINSFSFTAAIVMFTLNNFLAFTHFTGVLIPFYELLGFFTICIWLVPFSLFISLSANDNVLPIVMNRTGEPMDSDNAFLDRRGVDAVGNYLSKMNTKLGFLPLMKHMKEKVFPRSKKMF